LTDGGYIVVRNIERTARIAFDWLCDDQAGEHDGTPLSYRRILLKPLGRHSKTRW
jgi:hypothetical protein